MLEIPSKLASAFWTEDTFWGCASRAMTGWLSKGSPSMVCRKRMAGLWRVAFGGTWISSFCLDWKGFLVSGIRSQRKESHVQS